MVSWVPVTQNQSRLFSDVIANAFEVLAWTLSYTNIPGVRLAKKRSYLAKHHRLIQSIGNRSRVTQTLVGSVFTC